MEDHVYWARRDHRAIWLGYVVLQTGLVGLFINMLTLKRTPAMHPNLVFGGAGLTMISIVVAHCLRAQSYKAGWRGDVVSREGYDSGNILYWTFLLLPPLSNFFMIALTSNVIWHLIFAVPCPILHIFSFPTGRALQPQQPRIDPRP